MFIDEIKITVTSGKGGNGIVHFRREKYVPLGGPDGGDGGRGGDVIFKVKKTLNTLSSFRQNQKFRAQDGTRAGGSNQTGKSGDDLILYVPPGTLVFDAKTDEIYADLTKNDEELIICKGGRGGRGNARFASSRNKAPRIAEKGEPGIELELRLELKLLADVGLIGVPNAGKSTLLSVISNAKPKIAAYPFTTLSPNLGVVRLGMDSSMVVADIPGLIEGAHLGIGLGHEFLRHIQRTKILIHILDGLGEEPFLDYAQINSELSLFDPKLKDKYQLVVFNKMDLTDVQDRWDAIEGQFNQIGVKVIPISAVTHQGVQEIINKTFQMLQDYEPEEEFESVPVYRFEADPREFKVTKLEDGWEITGQSIERAAAMTYWEYDQSVRRFQRILEVLGIDEALRDAGIEVGDTVFIGENELDWQD